MGNAHEIAPHILLHYCNKKNPRGITFGDCVWVVVYVFSQSIKEQMEELDQQSEAIEDHLVKIGSCNPTEDEDVSKGNSWFSLIPVSLLLHIWGTIGMYWRVSVASKTLLGLINGNQRHI